MPEGHRKHNGVAGLSYTDRRALDFIRRSGFVLVTNPNNTTNRKATLFTADCGQAAPITLTVFKRLSAAGAIKPIEGETLLDDADPQRWVAA